MRRRFMRRHLWAQHRAECGGSWLRLVYRAASRGLLRIQHIVLQDPLGPAQLNASSTLRMRVYLSREQL